MNNKYKNNLNQDNYNSDKRAISDRINESKMNNRYGSTIDSDDYYSNEETPYKDEEEPQSNLEKSSETSEEKNTDMDVSSNLNVGNNVSSDNVQNNRPSISNIFKSLRKKEKTKSSMKAVESVGKGLARVGGLIVSHPIITLLVVLFIFFIIIVVVVFNSPNSTLDDKYTEDTSFSYFTFAHYEVGQTTEQINKGYAESGNNNTCGNLSIFAKIRNLFGNYDLTNPSELCTFIKNIHREYQRKLYVSNFLQVEWANIGRIYRISPSDIREMKREKEEHDKDSSVKTPTLDEYSGLYHRDILSVSESEISAYEKAISDINEDRNPIDLNPGLIYSTLYYAYETQINGTIDVDVTDENGEKKGNLDSISSLFSNNIYNKNSIIDMYENYIQNGYLYYTYVVDENGRGECKQNWHNASPSNIKYDVFLKYGSVASAYYEVEDNKNRAIDDTPSECYGRLSRSEKVNLSGLEASVDIDDKTRTLISASKDSSSADVTVQNNNEGTYKYSDGFMFKTFPRYLAKYNSDKTPDMEYVIAREIEMVKSNIYDREDYVNLFLGYPSTIEGGLFSNGISSGDWASWRQTDPAWGSIIIGVSRPGYDDDRPPNIHNIGCYFTAITMAIADKAKHVTISNLNPGTLANAALAAGNVFESDGSTRAGALIKLAIGSDNYSISSSRFNPYDSFASKASLLSEKLNEGYAIVLQVQNSVTLSRGWSSSHYVYVTGVKDGKIYIADPNGANTNATVLDPDMGPGSWYKYINEGIESYLLIKFS